MGRHAIALLVCLLPVVAGAEIYRWVDEQGKVHFSDVAPADAQAAQLPEATGRERIQTTQAEAAPPAALDWTNLPSAGPAAAWVWQGEMAGKVYRLTIPAGWGEIPPDMLLAFEKTSESRLHYTAGFRRWDTPDLVAPLIVVAPEPVGKIPLSQLAATRRGANNHPPEALEKELERRAGEGVDVEEVSVSETGFDEETLTMRLRMEANGMQVLGAVVATEVGKLNLVGFFEPADLENEGAAFEELVGSLELSPALVYQRAKGALSAQDRKTGKVIGTMAGALFLLPWLFAALFSGGFRTGLRAAAWIASLGLLAWGLNLNRGPAVISEASGAYFAVLLGFALLRALIQRMRRQPEAMAPLPGAAAGR